MSYQSQAQLEANYDFQQRNRACAIQQADTPGVGDTSPATVALAGGVKRDDGPYAATFVRLAASGPGIADKVDNGDGTIDQANVADAEILSLTQANWPVVAGLYFSSDGTPLT